MLSSNYLLNLIFTIFLIYQTFYTMLSSIHTVFLVFFKNKHTICCYYSVRHCIIQLLSAWMSQDMPTPLSCLSFLSVFLFFSSPLSHFIMILFCLNNVFFFSCVRGQSLSSPLSLHFPTPLNLLRFHSFLLSPRCIFSTSVEGFSVLKIQDSSLWFLCSFQMEE